MDYKRSYEKLIKRVIEQRNRSRESETGAVLSLSFFRSLFFDRIDYLLWALSIVAVQIIELITLAFIHYVYFPPESLFVLRLLSTGSVCGIFFASYLRFFRIPDEHFSSQSYIENRRVRIMYSARKTLLIGFTVSASLVVYLLGFTHLHFSAPPIFRAVIFSAIFVFPFDLYSTILLYNLKVFRAPPLRTPIRLIALSAMILSLAALAAGQTLLFFLAAILPRLVIAHLLSRHCFGSTILQSLDLRFSQSKNVRVFSTYLRKHVTPGFAFFIVLEGSLYITFTAITNSNSNIALMMFFIHKMLHLSTVLGLKASLRLIRSSRRAWLVADSDLLGVSRLRIFLAALFYSSLSLILVPLFLLKQELLFWATPTGDYPELNASLFIIAVFSVIARSYSAMLFSWTFMFTRGRPLSYWKFIYPIALSVILWVCSLRLMYRYDLDILFQFYILIDGIIALWFSYSLVKVLRASPLKSHSPTDNSRFLTLQAFLAKLQSDRITGKILLLEFWNNVTPSLFESSSDNSILMLLAKDDLVSRFGPRACIVCFAGSAEMCKGKAHRLKISLAAVLRQTKECTLTNGAVYEALASLYGTIEIFIQRALALSRGAAYRRTIDTENRFPDDTALEAILDSVHPSFRSTEQGFLIWRSTPHWSMKIDCAPDVKERFYRYLEYLLDSGDLISGWLWNRSDFKGMFHVNSAGNVNLIGYVPPEHRDKLFALRANAFKHNILDMLGMHTKKSFHAI